MPLTWLTTAYNISAIIRGPRIQHRRGVGLDYLLLILRLVFEGVHKILAQNYLRAKGGS